MGVRWPSTGRALRADANQEAIGAAELSFDHRKGLGIAGERLPLGERAAAEHLENLRPEDFGKFNL